MPKRCRHVCTCKIQRPSAISQYLGGCGVGRGEGGATWGSTPTLPQKWGLNQNGLQNGLCTTVVPLGRIYSVLCRCKDNVQTWTSIYSKLNFTIKLLAYHKGEKTGTCFWWSHPIQTATRNNPPTPSPKASFHVDLLRQEARASRRLLFT